MEKTQIMKKNTIKCRKRLQKICAVGIMKEK